MFPSVFCLAALLLSLVLSPAADQPLQLLPNCRFLPTDWADGDSFRIQTPDGTQLTVRLYGADCLESRATDESDARRLREQRRYFGIAAVGGSSAASSQLAQSFGRQASAATAAALSQPFSLHTSFADARGDSTFQRVYGFITTHTGDDLAQLLIRQGLARAFGVSRESPSGASQAAYRESLRDLELRAAKLGLGIWAKTNWESLPSERQLQREDDSDLATNLPKAPPAQALNINRASLAELMNLPGIGEVTANRILQARPFSSLDDLSRVPGLGPKTLAKLRPHLVLR